MSLPHNTSHAVARSSMRTLARWAATALLLIIGSTAAWSRAQEQQHVAGGGEITLPLERYDALLEEIERAEQERARLARAAAPTVAEITSAVARFDVEDEGVRGVIRFEVLVSGGSLLPVSLPVTGFVTASEVQPEGAALSQVNGQLGLLAERAGTYVVTLDTYLAFPDARATLRIVPLPGAAAPVATTTVELDAELLWKCEGATVVRNRVDVPNVGAGSEDGGRRSLELMLPRDQPCQLRLRQPFASEEAERAVVRTTTATVLDITRRGVGRTDVVLFDVARGAVATHQLLLPAGLDPEVIATDEGVASSERDGSRVTIYRERLLEGMGTVQLQTPLRLAESIELDPVTVVAAGSQTGGESRGHYLVVRAGVAAEIAPQQEGSWRRRDTSDLPPQLQASLGRNVTSIWQLEAAADPGRLAVQIVAEAEDLGAVVRRRESTSLLTVDGSLVTREVFLVVGRSSALEVTLPEGSELWSMSVDGSPSRPLESQGKVYLPLSLANDGLRTIELVSVQSRAVPAGKARMALQLAAVATPVLEHRWRVLLPEGKQYRYAGGELRPNVSDGPDNSVDIGRGPGAVRGRISHQGSPLPGVTVTLRTSRDSFTTFTDVTGWYSFRGLGSGRQMVSAFLEGFSGAEQSVRIRGNRTALVNFQLSSSMEETITVTSESPLLDEAKVQAIFEQDAAEQRQQSFRKEAVGLVGGRSTNEPQSLVEPESAPSPKPSADAPARGRVAGVRPLPVDIPERGKILSMTGVLPSELVTVELEVRDER